MKILLTTFLMFPVLVCITGFSNKSDKQTDNKLSYTLKDAGISFSLPNDNWFLTNRETADRDWYYCFKRNEIYGTNGRGIIPGIIVKFADARQYKGKVKAFADDITKQYPGFTIDRIYYPGTKDYPINYKNSYMIKGSHSENGYAHVMYLIYMINTKNIGIGIGMDMTKNIAAEYESEFWTTMRSIKMTQ